MTDIDPTSDIELRTVNEHVVVRVPLAGSVDRRVAPVLSAAGGLQLAAQNAD